jgi:pyridinium-3,5-bisthiocarboxylic acid mononucleotide nickel chelatase
MTIGILDPFSGIAGDMTLGALVDCGLDPAWLLALPGRLGLDGVSVQIRDVIRGELACKKVDFDIPPQPHGRHLSEIRSIVARSDAPPDVRARADAAFLAIATVEGAIHGVRPESVHLHEVGAVDAILDVLGSIWGFAMLGVDTVYCGPIALGDGTVESAHGTLPVPAPATLKLLEGLVVRPGPAGSGELVTPTGAALVRVLSAGQPPSGYVVRRSGLGAGTKEFHGRANALRLILGDPAGMPGDDWASRDPDAGTHETVVSLAADIDDMLPEYVAAAADMLRRSGALDVVLLAATMKKGRLGTRIEVLARPADAGRLEQILLTATTTIGVRRQVLERRVLPRRQRAVSVLGHRVAVKETTLPNGETRAKPEFDDVLRVAQATGRPAGDIFALTAEAAQARRYEPDAVPAGVSVAGPGPARQGRPEGPDDHSHHSHDQPHDHSHDHEHHSRSGHDHPHGHS